MMKKENFMTLHQPNIFKQLLNRYQNSYLSYFLMYNFYFLSWALFSSFISVYILDKGFRPSEVSLVVSVSFLSSMAFQPIIGMLSDKFSLKLVNTILFMIAMLGGIYFVNAKHLIELVIGYSLVMTLINGTNPVMERIATTSPYPYGKIRIWGTIGYALGTQLAGWLYAFIAPSAIFITFVFTMTLSIVGLLGTTPQKRMPNKIKNESQKQNVFKELFTNKQYLYYILVYALFCGVTNMVHTFTPAYFQAEGLSVSTVSTIVSVAVIFEGPIVIFSYKFMDKLGNKTLMLIAFCLVMGLYAIYACQLWLPLQVAATLIVKHPAGMLFGMINLKAVNTLVAEKYQITALAFVQTCRNLSSVIFQNIGGQLLNVTTYKNMYVCALLIIFVGFVLTLMFKIPSGKDKKLFN